MKKSASSPANTPALAALAKTSIPYRVHTYDNESDHYGKEAADVMVERLGAVSYTHLTLPTIYSV